MTTTATNANAFTNMTQNADTNPRQFTLNDERIFIEHALQDEAFYQHNIKAFKNNGIWTDKNSKKVVSAIASYYEQYHAMPDRKQLKAIVALDGSLIGEPGYNVTPANTQWAHDRLQDFWNDRVSGECLQDAFKLHDDGKFASIMPLFNKANDNLLHPAVGKPINLTDDLEAMMQDLTDTAENKISSGWNAVDDIMEGGFSKGELNIFCAKSGQGKSISLCNVATNLARQGKKVLFITLELSEYRVLARLGQQFTGCRTNDSLELAQMKLKLQKLECKSNIDVKFMRRGASASDIDALIKETKKEYDAVCVDYMDLVSPNGQVAQELKFKADDEMSYELREIAVNRNIALFTASQLNRSKEKKPGETYELESIAGGYSKAFNADNVIVFERITNKKEIEEDAKARGGDSPIPFQVLGYKIYFPKIRNGANNGAFCNMNWDAKSIRILDRDDSEYNDLPKPKKETEPMLTEDNDHDDDPTPPNDDGPGGLPGPSSEKSADASADADAGDTVVDDVGTAETPQSEDGSGDLSQGQSVPDGDGQSQDGEITEKETAPAVSTPEKETENASVSAHSNEANAGNAGDTADQSEGEITENPTPRVAAGDAVEGPDADADADAGIEGELKLMAVEQMQSAGLTEPEMQQVIKSDPEWFDADLEPIINDIISNRKDTENEPSEADLGTDAGDGAPSDGAATETEASAPTDNAEGPDSTGLDQDEGRVEGTDARNDAGPDAFKEDGSLSVNAEIAQIILNARHGAEWDVEKAAEISGISKDDIFKIVSREIYPDLRDDGDSDENKNYHKDLGGLWHDMILYRRLTCRTVGNPEHHCEDQGRQFHINRLKAMGLTDDDVALLTGDDDWFANHRIYDDAREILATRNENGTENEATDGSESGATEGSAPGTSKDATGGKSPQPDTAEAGGSKILGVPATTPAVENSAPENDQDGQKSPEATSASQTYERQHAVPSAPKDKEPKSIRVENDPELDELNRIEREKAANSTSTLAAGIIDRLKKEGKIE